MIVTNYLPTRTSRTLIGLAMGAGRWPQQNTGGGNETSHQTLESIRTSSKFGGGSSSSSNSRILIYLIIILCDQLASLGLLAHAAGLHHHHQASHQRARVSPKFKVIEQAAESTALPPPPPEQRLALQIMITESAADSNQEKKIKQAEQQGELAHAVKSNQHAAAASRHHHHRPSRLNLKRPYDIGLENVGFHNADLTPMNDNRQFFYTLDDGPLITTASRPRPDSDEESLLYQSHRSTSTTSTPSTTSTSLPPTRPPAVLNQRSELIRTQHRPPWFKQQLTQGGAQKSSSSNMQQLMMMMLADEKRARHRQQMQLLHHHQQQQNMRHANEFSGQPGNNNNNNNNPNNPKRVKLQFTTTIAPGMSTTEFFKLISSAHSPIRVNVHKLSRPLFYSTLGELLHSSKQVNETDTDNERHSNSVVPGNNVNNNQSQFDPSPYSEGPKSLSTTTSTTRVPSEMPQQQSTSDILSTTTLRPTNESETAAQNQTLLTSRSGVAPANRTSASQQQHRVVMAPELLVKDDDDEDVASGHDENSNSIDTNGASEPHKQLAPRRHLVNYTIKSPSLKRPVTIIRHSSSGVGSSSDSARPKPARRRQQTTSTTTELPSYLVIPHHIRLETTTQLPPPALQTPPERVVISSSSSSGPEQQPTLAPALVTASAAQTVRLIAKQKHKYDDNITSPPLTVIDNDAFRLPQNTTAVHNNRLLVRIKPGQSQPTRFQVTTEYPYYNPVAGITPSYPSQSTTTTRQPYTNGGGRPTTASTYKAPVPGQPHYGYVRPTPGETGPSSNQGNTNNKTGQAFGAQNIRFPASPSSTNLVSDHQDPPATLPERVNVSVPSDANIVGPNKVPDRVVLETDERPGEGVTAISDATIVARPPYGTQVTVNQDGIIRLSTTRRPSRHTTKRVNIVSANTTVITANPDQLNDVLSNVIDSHAHGHHSSRPAPTPRPSILASIAKIFNASVATTAIALMTLIKTILIALLVMFLPPIALTAAIVQAVSLG